MPESPEIHLLKLAGSDFEMGRAHGLALKQSGKLRALDFYSDFLFEVFRFQAPDPFTLSVRTAFRWWVGETIERAFVEAVPSAHRAMASGLSEGSGVPLGKILKAHAMPDVYSYLLARRSGLFPSPSPAAPAPGCTSFVWGGPKDSEIPMLHARTLDFPGGEAWTDAPAIVECAPEGGQRYVYVTTLGVATGGITAMNEAGLTLSLHMNYSKRVSSRGVPVVVIGDEIMRRAGSLTQALDILRSFPRSAGWSFLISSHREKEAAAVEMDASSISVRPMKGRFLVMTNHFLDPDLAAHEYWITPGRAIDTRARYDRISQLLSGEAGPPTLEKAVRFLRDSYDPNLHAERTFGSTVCQVHAVSAVVFDPSHQRILVGAGRPPLPKSEFRAYSCFPGPFPTDFKIGAEPANDHRRRFALAHEAYFPSGDLKRVEGLLSEALAMSPNDAMCWSMLGLTQLKAVRLDSARKSLEKALSLEETPYRRAQNRLYLARTLDLSGDRATALSLYTELAGDPWCTRQAREGARRPWNLRRNRGVVLDFTVGDAVEI
jgi:hypothetical protein